MLKYPSIENSYRSKHIQYWLERHPELINEEYIIQEKIHGANIQFIFDLVVGDLQIASRNRVLSSGESFFDVWNVIKDYEKVTEAMWNMSERAEVSIRLYGEIFGPGIGKGVQYFDKKQIRFFDMRVDNKMIEPVLMNEKFHEYYIEDYLVPLVAKVKTLQAALDIDTVFSSMITPESIPDNICEGVVIKPFNHVYTSEQGSIFYLKKKNDSFKEKADAKKPPLPDNIISLNLVFRSYINEQRVQSVFSKHGEIERPQQIGEYIQLVLSDAKEDFIKDNDEIEQLEKKEQKSVYNVGSTIVNILKGYL